MILRSCVDVIIATGYMFGAPSEENGPEQVEGEMQPIYSWTPGVCEVWCVWWTPMVNEPELSVKFYTARRGYCEYGCHFLGDLLWALNTFWGSVHAVACQGIVQMWTACTDLAMITCLVDSLVWSWTLKSSRDFNWHKILTLWHFELVCLLTFDLPSFDLLSGVISCLRKHLICSNSEW